MPATKSLEDLFVNLLKDIYYAEKQILKTLPKMAKKADSDELRQAFEHHLKETEGQVERLEQVFALCDLKPTAQNLPGDQGHHRGGRGRHEGGQGPRRPRRRHDRRRPGRRALRDRPLRHDDRLGQAARHEGRGSLLQQTLDQEYNADRP